MLIDTHGHLNFNDFREDSKEVFNRTLSLDMGLVMPGSQYSTSRRAVELAEKWNSPRVWAAIGLHPIHLEEGKIHKDEIGEHVEYETHAEKFDRSKYEELARSEKVVAIGEAGLDYWWRPKTKEAGEKYAKKQKEVLRAQMDMALDLRLPLILHCRVAHKDLIKILREHPHTKKLEVPGVVHSYTGSVKQLKKFLDMGYYIGINALVFKLGMMEEAAVSAPLERILLETDSPYLSPPKAQSERNEPANVKYIAEHIAEIKNISFDKVEKQTTENAKKVFGVFK
jgi:TatD DNase family protein